MRRCTCDNYIPNQPFVEGRDCKLCWLYYNNEKYRKYWDSDKVKSITQTYTTSEIPKEITKLAGDHIADLICSIGIPPCSGCRLRKEWINKAHLWLKEKLNVTNS